MKKIRKLWNLISFIFRRVCPLRYLQKWRASEREGEGGRERDKQIEGDTNQVRKKRNIEKERARAREKETKRVKR